jgi:two-component system sensor histidine kinase VicK
MFVKRYSLRPIKEIAKISNDGFLAYNVDKAEIEFCNKSLSRILGKSVSQIKAEGIDGLAKMVKDDDGFLISSVNQLKAEAKISNLEVRLMSDPEKYISIDAYFIANGNIIVALIKDITKSKEHQNYIVEFGARKDTLLDMVCNNLSGPLNLINNLLDSIDRANKAQEYRKVDNSATLIRENTQHCIDVISSFLREEHLLSPTISVERKRFDVMSKVNVVLERYKEFARRKKFETISSKKQLFVTGDDVKFFQIINNLISNAIKFTADDGKIVIEVREHPSTFTVSVSDDGIGIPDYLRPHLFKKNTPASRPGLRGEKSIGMGLYIVRKLVDLMNGSLSLQSEENEGSTFIVEFPKLVG